MSKEYIEREAVIEKCNKLLNNADSYPNPHVLEGIQIVRDLILTDEETRIPAADVEPVRHGKWLERYGESYLVFPIKYDEDGLPVLQPYINYECSECGKVVSKQYPYCNCGAKMDRGNK